MKKKWLLLLIVLLVITLAGCVPEAHEQITKGIALDGFWSGLWHGLILPITFVWSLFDSSVTIYETLNNGGWYNFGFLLGAGSALGGGSSAASR